MTTPAETVSALADRLVKREHSQGDITTAAAFLRQFARAIAAVEEQVKP